MVVTRAPEQSGELVKLLTDAGARVVEVPTLVTVPVDGDELSLVDAALRDLAAGAYDGVIVTSRNTVAFVHERLLALGLGAAAVAGTPVFAIGPATARALVERGYEPPTVAEEAVAEGLLATVRDALDADLAGMRFLLPRAREGRDVVIEGLRRAGARVDLVVVYETRPVTSGPGLPAGTRLDWVTFMSPTAVRAFVQRFGNLRTKVAVVGPVTAKAVREAGLEVDAMGEEHTAAGMVAAMVAAAGTGR